MWTGSNDGTLFALPITSEASSSADATQAHRIRASSSASSGITCMTAVGDRMWVGRANGSISIYESASENLINEVISRPARVSCMGIVGHHVWVGFSDRHIAVHDARTAELLYGVGDQGESRNSYVVFVICMRSAHYAVQHPATCVHRDVNEVMSWPARVNWMDFVGHHVWVGFSDRHIAVHDARTAELLYGVGDQGEPQTFCVIL